MAEAIEMDDNTTQRDENILSYENVLSRAVADGYKNLSFGEGTKKVGETEIERIHVFSKGNGEFRTLEAHKIDDNSLSQGYKLEIYEKNYDATEIENLLDKYLIKLEDTRTKLEEVLKQN